MRLFLFFCVLFIAGSVAAQPYGPLPSPATLNGLGIGTQFLLPTPSSTSAAAANTTLIQNALSAGGRVEVGCNPATPVFYVNGPIVINSNNDLELDAGCYWTQPPGTGTNMLVNAAYNRAWATLYANSGVVTTGPLSVIWSGNTPTWAISTAYTQGNYVVSPGSGKIYWQSTASCTSSGSGTGPTGTGTGISDGTCSWNYVTAAPFAATAQDPTELSAIITWTAHGLTAGQAIMITPQPDSGPIWTGTGSAHALGGPCDSAYFGTFHIIYVNDANHFTVTLRRMPGAAFTGIPMYIKQADQNITIGGGGTFDYNSANQSGPLPSYIGAFAIITEGVENLNINNVLTTNVTKWGYYGIGLSQFSISGAWGAPGWTPSSGQNQGPINIYGPSWDGDIHNIWGTSADDVIAIATQYHGSGASSYTLAAGDVLNVTVRNVASLMGLTVSVYPVDANSILDGIVIDQAQQNTSPQWNLTYPTIRISATGNPGTGVIGSLVLRNIEQRNANAPAIDTVYGGSWTINNLVLDNVRTPRNPQTRGGLFREAAQNTYTHTINHLVVQNSTCLLSASNSQDACILLQPAVGGTTVINSADFHDNYALGLASAKGSFFNALNTGVGTITLGTIRFDSNYGASLNNFANLGVAGDYHFTNNRVLTTAADLVTYGTSTIYLTNNYLSGATNGIIRYGAVVTNTIYSSGNTLAGSSIWFTYPSAGTSTVYGWDIQCDVTKLTRTTGSFCYNTNTAPGSGTLNTAGLVIDQGTGSLSWGLLSNFSGQQY